MVATVMTMMIAWIAGMILDALYVFTVAKISMVAQMDL
jgi:hypothetical protein